jgi:DNA polymerase IV
MLKWLLFDLNSYFASCEQQADPSIRGKPVVVVPSLTNSTSVIASSYEARQFGIKTGTKVGDAKKMCPQLILRTGNHKLYTEFHHKIIAAVEEVLPIKKVLSIDEVACELIGREQVYETAQKIAQQMKDHVRSLVGSEIKSSVGVGPNILIAKIASDMQKPDGLVMVPTYQILQKIGPLPIQDLPGVGHQMKIRLNAKGYRTIADFIKAPEHELRKHWGSIWGLRVARELKGEDIPYNKNPNQNSMSHQHVLPPVLRNVDNAFQVVTKLLMKAAARLRDEKMKCHRLSVYVKCLDGTRFENTVYFSETHDTYFLVAQLKKLWRIERNKKPLKVAIALSDLTDGPVQMSLFDSPKSNGINLALDKVNSRFGANSLYLASTTEVLGSAKTRISFNHIPKLSDEFDEVP